MLILMSLQPLLQVSRYPDIPSILGNYKSLFVGHRDDSKRQVMVMHSHLYLMPPCSPQVTNILYISPRISSVLDMATRAITQRRSIFRE